LLRKRRSYAEIYNDLHCEVVNVFKVARDNGEQLKNLLYLTPFSRQDFIESYQPSTDPVEQARRTIVRSFMGFGSAAVTKTSPVNNRFSNPSTGFRSNSNRSGTTPAHDWKNYAEVFDLIIDRLRGVVIENRDALEVMAIHDSPDTLHYVDPPYVLSTRTDARADYKHELTDSQHVDLASCLKTLKGQVILSGYACDMYDDLFGDWKFIDKATHADGAKKRVERLWFRNCSLPQEQLI